MRGTAGLILAFIVLSGLAGCLQRPDATAGQSVPDGVALPRPTVVALLDSGINPYHEAFRASGVGAPLLENLGISATRVNLSMMGSWQDRSAADDAFWQSVQSGELYAFSGTRVLAVTMGNGTQYGRILDNAAHGTQVAGVLAREDPNAIIVMVQVDGGFCPLSGKPGCIDDASIARGMQWAASQPWIDVISVSIGLPGNVASPDAIESTARPYVVASRLAHENGKLIVTGAGNEPTPTIPDYFDGPPWVISVGGVHPSQRGDEVTASKMFDVVSNVFDWMPTSQSTDGYDWGSGTSFSAPNVAGALSRALYQIRSELHHTEGITSDHLLASGTLPNGTRRDVASRDLRDALNASAIYWNATDWSPMSPASNNTFFNLVGHSAPILVQPAQMGWGYVNGTIAPAIAHRVLAGDTSVPASKAIGAQYQAQYQRLREEYWSRQ